MFKLQAFNTYCPKTKMHKTPNLHGKMHPKHKKELELNFAFNKPTKSFEKPPSFLSIVHLQGFLGPLVL
jgi:hypothetical protein